MDMGLPYAIDLSMIGFVVINRTTSFLYSHDIREDLATP